MNIENREERALKVLVIGGGASGLTAALTALGGPAQRTSISPNCRRACARKLLATAETAAAISRIGTWICRTTTARRRSSVCPRWRPSAWMQTLAWFRSMGLHDRNGAGRPRLSRKRQRNSVADVLRLTLGRASRTSLHARGLRDHGAAPHERAAFFPSASGTKAACLNRVIVCAGGAAGGKLGGNGPRLPPA